VGMVSLISLDLEILINRKRKRMERRELASSVDVLEVTVFST
jgi:hypothetical protein